MNIPNLVLATLYGEEILRESEYTIAVKTIDAGGVKRTHINNAMGKDHEDAAVNWHKEVETNPGKHHYSLGNVHSISVTHPITLLSKTIKYKH